MTTIAVVGCGYWGPNLLRNFISLPRCRVKLICDTDTNRLEHLKALYPGLQGTTEFQAVLGDAEIQAVVIATPVRFHFDMAMKCLEAGKHVLVEKPMARTSAEVARLMERASEKRLTLMVGHTYVYSAPVRRIRQIIDDGDLGEIQYISARRLNLGLFQTDINVAWDLGPHDISIILHILGAKPAAVNCQGKAHVNREIEDVTNMTLTFGNGGFATIQNSWLDPNKVREMTFVGSRRMLVYNDLEAIEKIKIYDKRVETPPHYDTFAEFQYSYHYGDMYSPYIKQTEPLKVECQHFLDCIQNDAKPISGAREALQVVKILEAADQSLKSGGGRVAL